MREGREGRRERRKEKETGKDWEIKGEREGGTDTWMDGGYRLRFI